MTETTTPDLLATTAAPAGRAPAPFVRDADGSSGAGAGPAIEATDVAWQTSAAPTGPARAATGSRAPTRAAARAASGEPAHEATLVGETVDGRYEVEALLGRGGMGAVYRARHALLDEPVALKVIRQDRRADPEVVRRFLREAKATLRIVHPHVVQVRDFGVHEGAPYMTLDLVQGESLRALLEREGRLAPRRAVALVRQCGLAVAAAHAVGVVHRDLKPDNVLVERDATGREAARVADFGLAKWLDPEDGAESLTQGAVVGTPYYLAPEQAAGEAVDGRADVYALGCVLFELLTGERPFRAATRSQLLLKHLTEAPTPPSRRAAGVPPALDAVVLRALAKHPDDRFAGAAELVAALDAAAVPAAAPARRGLRVLLAEDNAVNQRLTTRLLERWGHEVATVSTGREALARLACERFDLVVMDGGLPELDGWSATAALRAREGRLGGPRTPVVALTGDPDAATRARAAGVDAFLVKPVVPDELAAAVAAALRPAAPPVDVAAALARAGGDAALLAEVAQVFREAAPALTRRIDEGVARADGAAVQRAAAALAQAAEDLSAGLLARLAREVGAAAADGAWAPARTGSARLARAISAVADALAPVERDGA